MRKLDTPRARYARLGLKAVALLRRHGEMRDEDLVRQLNIKPEQLSRVMASEPASSAGVRSHDGLWSVQGGRKTERRVSPSPARMEAEIGQIVAMGDLGSAGDPLEITLRPVAETGDAGRYGDRKVFISALHDRVGRQLEMDLSTFKRWLVAQHQASKLVLARADLVAAMDPDAVARSEARADGATFHFVVDPLAGRGRSADLARSEVESQSRSGSSRAPSSRRVSARRQWEDLMASGSTSAQAWEDVAVELRSEARQAVDSYRPILLDRAEVAEQRAQRYRRG